MDRAPDFESVGFEHSPLRFQTPINPTARELTLSNPETWGLKKYLWQFLKINSNSPGGRGTPTSRLGDAHVPYNPPLISYNQSKNCDPKFGLSRWSQGDPCFQDPRLHAPTAISAAPWSRAQPQGCDAACVEKRSRELISDVSSTGSFHVVTHKKWFSCCS